MKSLLIGVFENGNKTELTKFGQSVDSIIKDEFFKVELMMGKLKLGKTFIFYGLIESYSIIVFIGLGDINEKIDIQDDLYVKKQNIRNAIGIGIKTIKKTCDKVKEIVLDDCGDPQLVGEAAILSIYSYKNYLEKIQKPDLLIQLYEKCTEEQKNLFFIGKNLAYVQNISRFLSETPSNYLTPTKFAEFSIEFSKNHNFEIKIHDFDWVKNMNMNAFLAVAQGSNKPLKFVEIHFKNCVNDEKPLIFVGKGITFDTGGICLKKNKGMYSQRADMSGGSCVLAVLLGLSLLKIKGYFIALIPLCENVISGCSVKPGDVVKGMNGKSIQINNTDAEGRLILSDALTYADTFNPKIVVDVATLTGAAKTALGQAASVVYSTNDELFKILKKSGQLTGDRVWKFPLYKDYVKLISNSILADVVNQSKDTGYGGSSCVAAAFLSKFIKCSNWIHIDMASTKQVTKFCQFMNKGMSGGPVRTLIKFVQILNNSNIKLDS